MKNNTRNAIKWNLEDQTLGAGRHERRWTIA